MGVALIFISALFFSLSSFFGKIVTNTTNMSGVITSFSRFFIGAVMMFIYMLATKKSFKPDDFKPILSRGVFNSFAIILMTGALNYTTMTNANMLNMTYPVLVILLAPILLKEKIKKSTYLYLAAIMLGSYIIADPTFGNINRGDLMGILSSLTASISVISLKDASNKNEGHVIVFYVMLIGTIINIPFSLHDI
ncbi:MAG TPA: DMT family transporter, partial [Tissierellaceae bacterium]|nr:DMT family transporter [Tissierellaceae bacterium]